MPRAGGEDFHSAVLVPPRTPVIPLVMYGVTLISRLQALTPPLWLVLLALPYLFLWLHPPKALDGLLRASFGINDGHFDWLLVGSAATVVASMVAQIGEQADFLRFMPEARTGRSRWPWSGPNGPPRKRTAWRSTEPVRSRLMSTPRSSHERSPTL